MTREKPLIFISCGQYTERERQLGKDICSLLAERRPDVAPYFAQNQTTAEGLSNHILKSLHRAAGFICVMHRRGELSVPEEGTITRGSVWIEQEIAIIAFMNHVLNRSIPILFYKQAGVMLEGIRQVLLMNPVEFTEESQVLEHLRLALPSAGFTPFRSYDVEPVLNPRLVSESTDRHIYELTADVKNVGNERVTDFEMRVFFPRVFLDPSVSWSAVDRNRSNASDICFSISCQGRERGGLYPGNSMVNPLTIEYFVDHDLDDDPRAMRSEIRVELYSGSMQPKKQTFPIREFLDF